MKITQHMHCKNVSNKISNIKRRYKNCMTWLPPVIHQALRAGRGLHADHMTMVLIVGWIQGGQKDSGYAPEKSGGRPSWKGYAPEI